MDLDSVARYIGVRIATAIATPLAGWGITSQHVGPLVAAAILVAVDVWKSRKRS